MLRRLPVEKMGESNLGWLRSKFHFSFAEYYNEKNINFGVLRVINDDYIAPGTGFPTHPHRDMEIISYVIEGKLTHKDSMGNESTLERGEVQYMSAGTGVTHSEYNKHAEDTRILQIWVLPDRKGHTPNYGEYKFKYEDRIGKWLHFVSSKEGDAPIKVNQDVNFYVTEIEAGKEMEFEVKEGRQAYVVQIEGKSEINSTAMNPRDGLETIGESLKIAALEKSHILVIEMKEREDLK
ncbi:Quercetin 2,3-dioxygenase [Sebaldella termitidis]|jgi:redox-sensitive bicupin YhaK (pirin superfamily)|uniref:Pirin domain protein n=1 Tax=Sebaldella termitidis (strain ATCC 33386 / NCTC 11300) TaxID=526218 RepID=D1AJD0_SEBTE|nr:pirin family protein [Sebaldella termitidis]ACZ08818.1 Pirin domain protein [Sebaldella termitidis ATCC 33386]SUI24138.1 Quercetin 2,3-dioxygenase [Sebaldella termitidis]